MKKRKKHQCIRKEKRVIPTSTLTVIRRSKKMGDAVDDAYEKSKKREAQYIEVETDIVDARLISELKVLRDEEIQLLMLS